MKALAERVNAGQKVTEEELELLDIFRSKVVNPALAEVASLYTDYNDASPENKKGALKDLQDAQVRLKTLNIKPFFDDNAVTKLMDNGLFVEATKLYEMKMGLEYYQQLGRKKDNVNYTLEVVKNKLEDAKDQFADDVEVAMEKYDVKTGQVTGVARDYNREANAKQESAIRSIANIDTRINNERQMATRECTRYQGNQGTYQRCIEPYNQAILQLQADAKKIQEISSKEVARLNELSKEYATLEEQGRQYVKETTGEEAPAAEVLTPAEGVTQNSLARYAQSNPQIQYQQTYQPPQQNFMGSLMSGLLGGAGGQFNLQAGVGQSYNPYMYQQNYSNPYMMQSGAYANPFGQQTGNPWAAFTAGQGQYAATPYSNPYLPTGSNSGINPYQTSYNPFMQQQPQFGYNSYQPQQQQFGYNPYQQQSFGQQQSCWMCYGGSSF